ncbi:hypothetical protein L2E82_16651 [Cichorium intybus]|uniref:Uncharacterized protein n=1 Tax=Cichorium intybus TaxID=13427 RepID=A0ACB9F7G4_CICIN|nr:hypothetical protein L2E82_16651 [Cichorium intybus]
MQLRKMMKCLLMKPLLLHWKQNSNWFEWRRKGGNRILDKMNRQKVSQVERLTQTVGDLKKLFWQEEKKIFNRELARAKISANRDAVVVANYWKYTDKKVVPLKQWLEERRVFEKYIAI